MKNVHAVLRQRVYASAGLFEVKPKYTKEEFEKLLNHQWSDRFELLMRNRLAMGMLRYGPFGEKNKPYFNMLDSIKKRIAKYKIDGNDEHLVDIANLALCEFLEGKHPLKHFKAQDEGPGCKA